jgi:hypothetical protein
MSSICRLERAAGRNAPCPEEACPFWEPGGAVLEGRCAFDRLDLTGRPEVVAELLRVRYALGSAVSQDAERDARHLFHRLLNESPDE